MNQKDELLETLRCGAISGKADGRLECVEVCEVAAAESRQKARQSSAGSLERGIHKIDAETIEDVRDRILKLGDVPNLLPPDAMRKNIERLKKENEELREERLVLDLENTRLLGAVEAYVTYFDESGEEITSGNWQILRDRLMALPANALPASDNSNVNYSSTIHPDSPPPAP